MWEARIGEFIIFISIVDSVERYRSESDIIRWFSILRQVTGENVHKFLR